MNRNTLINIAAIFTGLLTVILLSTMTDFILESLLILPSATEGGLYDDNLLVLAFIYRSFYTLLGGYIAAKISATNTKQNILIMGTIGTLFGILGIIVGLDLSHHWYPIAIALFGFPCVWAGYKLAKK